MKSFSPTKLFACRFRRSRSRPRFRNLIRRLHPQLKRKVRAALADILADPECEKPLKEELLGYWSLPIGRTRIVYRLVEGIVEIVAIGPRQTIYEDALRQIVRSRVKP